jgi:peroxiredoxin
MAMLLACAGYAPAMPTAPRRSPDFSVYEPAAKQTLRISSLKGKVVVIEFLFLQSAHCLRVAQMLNDLHKELGPRGLQPVGIVFGPNMSEAAVTSFVQHFKLGYPVGYATTEQVDSYMGRGAKEVLNVPQIVVIDRVGMIRAQNGSKYDLALENESALRDLLDRLLKENGKKKE